MAYFGNLQRDCYGPFDIRSRYLDHWTALGREPLGTVRMLIVLLVFHVMVVLFFVVIEYVPPFVFLLVLMGLIIFGIGVSVVEKVRPPPGPNELLPGMIRKYHVSLEEAVKRVNLALIVHRVPFTAFGVVLSDTEGHPKGQPSRYCPTRSVSREGRS